MEKEPLRISPIYRNLQDKNLLVIDTRYTTEFILEEAKMQKMNAYAFQSTPVVKGEEIPIHTFMEQKNIDYLVIHPYKSTLNVIQQAIDEGRHVILLKSDFSVNKKIIRTIKKWETQGVPTIDKVNLSELPRLLSAQMSKMT